MITTTNLNFNVQNNKSSLKIRLKFNKTLRTLVYFNSHKKTAYETFNAITYGNNYIHVSTQEITTLLNLISIGCIKIKNDPITKILEWLYRI